jgi:hypothetical protein
MTTKTVSAKQIDLITKHAAVVTGMGIEVTEATKDTWRASGVLGRILDPKQEVIGALKELNARPFYARSSREAEMQLTVLRALTAYERNLDSESLIQSLAQYFRKRETA